jgi:hypothetical protein
MYDSFPPHRVPVPREALREGLRGRIFSVKMRARAESGERRAESLFHETRQRERLRGRGFLMEGFSLEKRCGKY